MRSASTGAGYLTNEYIPEASLEETSASLEEIASMTKRNAENAISAKDLSADTRKAAEIGSSNMDEMNRAMADIQASSSNISKIIKTIDEIAFQTNILALNAAVEAARAATLREIVAELQKLVSGSSQTTGFAARREIVQTRPYRAPAREISHIKTTASRSAIGSSRPALGTLKKKNPETEIPLEEGVKDF